MRNKLILTAALLFCAGAYAQTNSYTVSNIVTNSQDPRLVNPWGLSRPASAKPKENEWWTADQVTGLSTLYYANGTIVGLAVTVPLAIGTGAGSPTGTASNPTNNNFAFATLDGTLSNWNPATTPGTPGKACAKCHVTTATIMVNNSASGASYQGLTIAKNATSGAETYYAANANGGVEAYDATSFSPGNPAGRGLHGPKSPQALFARRYSGHRAENLRDIQCNRRRRDWLRGCLQYQRQASVAIGAGMVQSAVGSSDGARQFWRVQQHDSGGEHRQRLDRGVQSFDRSVPRFPGERRIGYYPARTLGT